MEKTILILGGAGFAGSNLAINLKRDYPKSKIICADNLKRRGSEIILARLKKHDIVFLHLDIRIATDFDDIKMDVDVVIDACAEPSVLSGISSTPDYLIQTNLFGTINCLNFVCKKKAQLIFLSTSRVYPVEQLNQINFTEAESRFELAAEQYLPGMSANGISEKFDLTGYRSFYGTSKLASEYLIGEYNTFYNLKTVVNRCGVLTGPWQMGKTDQGVIVLWLAKHYFNGTLEYIGFSGNGKQVRDLLHIDDLYSLVKRQIEQPDLFNGQVFNIGGGNLVNTSLKELTQLCAEVTGNKIPVGTNANDRPADIRIYISDNRKITDICGWTPTITPRAILSDIFDWIRINEQELKPILS